MVDVKGHGRPNARVGALGSVVGLCAFFWAVGFGAVGITTGQWDPMWWSEPEPESQLVVAYSQGVAAPHQIPSPGIGASRCHPSYGGCVPTAPDVDCEAEGDGPLFVRGTVRVVGLDVYGLDPDNNGIGCE